jgi:hypothetical protein
VIEKKEKGKKGKRKNPLSNIEKISHSWYNDSNILKTC